MRRTSDYFRLSDVERIVGNAIYEVTEGKEYPLTKDELKEVLSRSIYEAIERHNNNLERQVLIERRARGEI